MWPFSSDSESDCDHTWSEYETESVMRGDFDIESGDMTWIGKIEIGERCVDCGETRDVDRTTRAFTYVPEDIIEHES